MEQRVQLSEQAPDLGRVDARGPDADRVPPDRRRRGAASRRHVWSVDLGNRHVAIDSLLVLVVILMLAAAVAGAVGLTSIVMT